jgi:hypothetical protein
MTKFRVFIGAPSRKDLQQDSTRCLYHWQTISSTPTSLDSGSHSVIFPPATLEAASRRISLMYQNIIFDDIQPEDDPFWCDDDEEDGLGTRFGVRLSFNLGYNRPIERTDLISWPPTEPKGAGPQSTDEPVSILDPSSTSRSRLLGETQETQDITSYNYYSDASSIARFPAFQFSLHALTSLSALAATNNNKSPRKVSLLLVALEVEGPDSIRIKKGADAGREVSILKMILGDADGQIGKLTAWREVADAWGGAGDSPAAVKRGDVVWIESAYASFAPSSTFFICLREDRHSCLQTSRQCTSRRLRLLSRRLPP